MSIIPEGEHIRNAVTWISDQRKDNSEKQTAFLVEEAGIRFNLSPADMDALNRILSELK